MDYKDLFKDMAKDFWRLFSIAVDVLVILAFLTFFCRIFPDKRVGVCWIFKGPEKFYEDRGGAE